MADQPRIQQPFANITPVVSYSPGDPVNTPNPDGVPKGKQAGKVSRAQLAIQGLAGLRM
jgi:hypothetical protein